MKRRTLLLVAVTVAVAGAGCAPTTKTLPSPADVHRTLNAGGVEHRAGPLRIVLPPSLTRAADPPARADVAFTYQDGATRAVVLVSTSHDTGGGADDDLERATELVAAAAAANFTTVEVATHPVLVPGAVAAYRAEVRTEATGEVPATGWVVAATHGQGGAVVVSALATADFADLAVLDLASSTMRIGP